MSREVVIGDWGSSRLRLWRLTNGKLQERREGPGMSVTSDPRGTLSQALDGWTPQRIVLCGMAGARGGMHEVDYAPSPVGAEQWARQAGETELAGVPVRIAAGIACRDNGGRPDVMRGEETQIFGAIARDGSLADGRYLVLLPGTHSKWAWLDSGRIAGFRTFMTGELFALLEQSSLSFAGASADEDELRGFDAGHERAGQDRAISSALFEARSRQLCDARSPAWARGFVSGLLISAEIDAMHPAGPVLVIGDPALAGRYREVLARRGIGSTSMNGDACVMAGLGILDERD